MKEVLHRVVEFFANPVVALFIATLNLVVGIADLVIGNLFGVVNLVIAGVLFYLVYSDRRYSRGRNL